MSPIFYVYSDIHSSVESNKRLLWFFIISMLSDKMVKKLVPLSNLIRSENCSTNRLATGLVKGCLPFVGRNRLG